jgi:hypothetical protein
MFTAIRRAAQANNISHRGIEDTRTYRAYRF